MNQRIGYYTSFTSRFAKCGSHSAVTAVFKCGYVDATVRLYSRHNFMLQSRRIHILKLDKWRTYYSAIKLAIYYFGVFVLALTKIKIA